MFQVGDRVDLKEPGQRGASWQGIKNPYVQLDGVLGVVAKVTQSITHVAVWTELGVDWDNGQNTQLDAVCHRKVLFERPNRYDVLGGVG